MSDHEEIFSLIVNTSWLPRDPKHLIFGEHVDVKLIDTSAIQERVLPYLTATTTPIIAKWITSLLSKDPGYNQLPPQKLFRNSAFAQTIFDDGKPSISLKKYLIGSALLSEDSLSAAYKSKSLRDVIMESGKAADHLIYEYWHEEPYRYVFSVTNNLPKDLIDKIIKKIKSSDKYYQFSFSSPLQNLSDEHFQLLTDKKNSNVNDSAIRNPKIPISLIRDIIKNDRSDWVKFSAILNPNCPIDILEHLAKEMHKYSRQDLANLGVLFNFSKNPNTPTHVFELLPYTLQEELAHPNCPQTQFPEMIKPSPGRDIIRQKIAANTSLTPEHAEILLSDPSVGVRSQLAMNASVPYHILKLLGLEFHKAITEALLRNERLRALRVANLSMLDADDLWHRLFSQITSGFPPRTYDFKDSEIRDFLDLLPAEEDFTFNKVEYKKRLKRIGKATFYKFL